MISSRWSVPLWPDRPPLVIVSGAPGSGKTTLATRLARELGLPLVTRDALKERLLDVLGAPDRARSREIGAASYAVLYAIAHALLDGEVGFVLESNFRRSRSAGELLHLVSRSRAILIHCHAPMTLVVERYRRRIRHPGHHDDANEVAGDLADFQPLDLAIPALLVDTSDGYRPSFGELVRFARAEWPRSPGT